MKGLLILPSFLLIIATLPLQSWAIGAIDPTTGNQFANPDDAADRSIALLLKLTSDVHAKQLGFASATEAHQAKRGPWSLRVSTVRLDKLQTRQPENDPEEILVDQHRIIYPITVDGKVKSSLTVRESAGGWRAMRRGSPKTIGLLDKFRTEHPASDSLIWVPSLNIILLADRTGGKFMVTSIADRHGLKAGQALAAQDAFSILAKSAKELADAEEDDDDDEEDIGGAM